MQVQLLGQILYFKIFDLVKFCKVDFREIAMLRFGIGILFDVVNAKSG